MSKSIKIAYLCWLTGGLFGLHHAYLGRDKQALVYFTTLGGFLLGMLIDLFRLPGYVREANQDEDYLKKLEELRFQIKVPAFFGQRFFGSILAGIFVYILVIYSWPTESLVIYTLVKLFAAYSTALIIYLVGTEFPMKCEFKWPLIGSLIGLMFSASVYLVPILAAFFLNWNIDWENDLKVKKEKKLKKKLAVFSAYSIVFVIIVSLCIWNNTTVKLEDGRTVTLKEAFTEFINSPAMQKTFELFETLWNYYKVHGLRKTINVHFYGYDPDALADAYKVRDLILFF